MEKNLTAPGFAIRRNGTCLKGLETDCGATLAPMRGCCPMDYVCPSQYNIACCPTGQNCTLSLLDPSVTTEVRCSNATWDLFDNGGYFCCEHGLKAYDKAASNVCAHAGYVAGKGEEPLVAVKLGTAVTTTSASSGALSTGASSTGTSVSATASHTEAASGNVGTPVGAIAGGVVGGIAVIAIVAILAWFFLRRRKQGEQPGVSDYQQAYEIPEHSERYAYKGDAYIHEAPGDRIYEVGDGVIGEMSAQERPAELPGSAK
ncbi:hypothetical protein CC80DRAFT_82025 [Byssothecium circinans]|uniref:Epidermal growth factor receptor-like transmembrane-juxtamembrane segment domain-containing protein n=1 Tax=Byssothecium circinans TaxID=147558 RepID=A0A6A5TW02_9PLEO|nr:hypothetical protein CC80DRAFT_82025 [Byssothecium circinans]